MSEKNKQQWIMVMNRNLSDKNFHILNNSIKTIKEQIKEAEEYQPGETK